MKVKKMSPKQRAAAMANIRAQHGNRTPASQASQTGRTADKQPYEMTFEEFKKARLTEKAGEVKTTEQSGMQTRPHGCPDRIWRMLALGGCLVISTQVAISPHTCPIIMRAIKAYRNYKTEIGNQNDLNRNDFKEFLKITSSGIGTKLSRNQIENYSNIIVEVTDSSGLTSLISNETNVNENTIRAMMKGTASNLLENGIDTATNFAIDFSV